MDKARTGLWLIGMGSAFAVSVPLASQEASDAALEAACRATEVTAPDSCPCTIGSARKVGLSDEELASLFKDDGHSQPVDQAKYGRFWQVKSQCIADATMAKMGISPGNPLPGVPAGMRPGAPFPSAGTPVPPIAREAQNAPAPAPVAAAPSAAQAVPAATPRSGRRSLAETEAIIAMLRGNAYEYTDDNRVKHRYDFLPEGDLVLYQSEDPGAAPGYRRYVELATLSAQEFSNGAELVKRDVASGGHAQLQILSAGPDHFLFNKAYVRSSEEWRFRKVGPARTVLPEDAPQPLADGFWQVRFDRKLDKTNPFFNQAYALAGWTNASNREAYLENLAGFGGLIRIRYTDDPDCKGNCILVVNDFDRRTRRAVGRLIEQTGVDSIAVRPERTSYGAYERTTPNRISVRAFDGQGGYTEWLCTDTPRRTCSETGRQAAPQAASATAGRFAERLGTVQGETWGEAACSSDFFLAPADRAILRDFDALNGFARTNRKAIMATLTDLRGSVEPGLKLRIDGRERVLANAGDNSWEGDGIGFVFRASGAAIYEEPAYGFTPGTVTLTIDGRTQAIEVIQNAAC